MLRRIMAHLPNFPDLHFNPKNIHLPLSTLATNYLLKKPSLKLIPETKELKNIFNGEATILKFLVRSVQPEQPLSSHPLYNEKQPEIAYEIDEWLHLLPQTKPNAKSIIELAQKIQETLKTDFLLNEMTLADLSLWGFFKSLYLNNIAPAELENLNKFQHWFQRMDQLEACRKAVSDIQSFVPSKPKQTDIWSIPLPIDQEILDFLKLKVAELVHSVAPQFPAETLKTWLETPRGAVAGNVDYCISVARLRIQGKNPSELAQEFAQKLSPNEYITEISSIQNYLNFKINKALIIRSLLPKIKNEKETFGHQKPVNKTIVIEFSSPNIAKPFHAGHLRSTIIGNFIKNVYQANGYKTVAINYLGDWGKQYGLLAVGFKQFGSEEELLHDPIHHLYNVYVQINKLAEEDPTIHDQARAYFKKMEDGDQEALQLWKRFRDLSIEKYKQIYARLNVSFDIYSGESMYQEGMKKVVQHLIEKNLLVESEGAQIVDLKPYKLTPALIQKADGSTLYLTRDIAAAWERHDQFQFDEMIYVVASQQDLHFKQLFKILDLAGFDWFKKCQHISFGLVKGMSTRRGTVVFLEEILNEAAAHMHQQMQSNQEKYQHIINPEKVADIIGLSAVIIQDMGARRVKDYDFDWNRMTSFEGDTGPYLQYSHARICSIERKAKEVLKNDLELPPNFFDHLQHPKFLDIYFQLAQFPDLLTSLPKNQFEPVHLVGYLMQLCHKISTCLEEVYVLGQEKDVAVSRYWAYVCARIVLSNGMRILGLTPLEQM